MVALLAIGCGTGLDVDPDLSGPPGKGRDARADNVLSDRSNDTPREPDVTRSDSRDDRSESADGGDVAPDAGDDVSEDGVDSGEDGGSTGEDVSNDESDDTSIDGTSDGDDLGDAADETAADVTSADVVTDTSLDGDARIVVSEGGDVPNDVRDAPNDGAIDLGSSDSIDGCTVGCGANEFDYYVDAQAAPGGDGSKEAPFQTISAAADAHAKATSKARKAHVAAGTYDAALGEVFPIMLRGLSLEGD
ncbi:MAG: DUF1565 domain-containing protein, partial [Polyangiaceae bacterium]